MLQETISDQIINTTTTTAPESAAAAAAGELGFVSEDGDRNSGGGNRWPRQETVALIKIRSDMDVVFRDSSLKAPLWDDVSRKLAELGYHRSAKKCKEKFENVYKYHKRTKDGRVSKQDGKTYRFFEQLEALEGHASTPLAASIQSPNHTNNHFQGLPQRHIHPVTNFTQNNVTSHNSNIQPYGNLSNSTSSSTSSELDKRGKKRKRKWKDFFERIMREVIDKQEALQMRFLETLERRERDRIAKEEAWRLQEMAKLNREHDLLVHERSITAAKDAAVISYLQKVSEQTPTRTILNFLPQNPFQVKLQEISIPQPTQTTPPPPAKIQPIQGPVQVALPVRNVLDNTPPVKTPMPVLELSTKRNGDNTLAIQTPIPALTLPIKSPTNIIGDNSIPPSPSRWPKAEIEALISLRTTLDMKYQENGPKGPLWEEISTGMKGIGYNRNAKRCKEKWENINKYYKKMKESNKKRPQDAKTCPYFDQLDAIYNEKAKNMPPINNGLPIMARPEQQWPLAAPPLLPPPPNVEKQINDEEESGEDENEEDEIDGYEIVQSKQSSMENVQ